MIPAGPVVPVLGVANSSTVPFTVIRPSLLLKSSVNHRLPSGPAAIADGSTLGVMPDVNSRITPDVEMRPIPPSPSASVNQRLPSGPAAIPFGPAPAVRPVENSRTVGVAAPAAPAHTPAATSAAIPARTACASRTRLSEHAGYRRVRITPTPGAPGTSAVAFRPW